MLAGLTFETLHQADVVDRLVVLAPRATLVKQWHDSLYHGLHIEIRPGHEVERRGQDGVVVASVPHLADRQCPRAPSRTRANFVGWTRFITSGTRSLRVGAVGRGPRRRRPGRNSRRWCAEPVWNPGAKEGRAESRRSGMCSTPTASTSRMSTLRSLPPS